MIKRNQYTISSSGEFGAYQVNVLVALTDIGKGDGGTMLIPGSHKANFEHPIVKEKLNQLRNGDLDAMRDVDGVPNAADTNYTIWTYELDLPNDNTDGTVNVRIHCTDVAGNPVVNTMIQITETEHVPLSDYGRKYFFCF